MHRPMRYSTSRKRQYLRNMPYKTLKNIAVIQSNHRNASLVHSHIAVLQFALFFSKLECKPSTLSRRGSKGDFKFINTRIHLLLKKTF